MKKLLLLLLVACGGSKPTSGPSLPPPTGGGDPVDVTTAPPKPEPPPPVVAGHPKTDLIPRDVLFGNPERASVRISPDGKQLSWLAPKDGVMNIWVAPIDKLDTAKVVTSETKRPIQQYSWAYTNKHLLYVQDSGGDEDFHVFRVDLADGKTTDLTPYPKARAGIADLDEKYPTTVVVSINDRDPKAMDLYKVDLGTGKRTLLVQNDDGFSGFELDDKLAVRFGTKKEADGSTSIMVPEKGGKWAPWDKIAFEDADTTGIAMVAPGGKSVIMTETRGRDTGAIVSVDIATKKQKVIASDPKSDAGGLMMHPTKHTLQAVAFDYGRTKWTVLDKSIQPDLDALAKVDGGEVTVGSRSLDDKTWIVVTRSEQHPVRYYTWNRAKQKATFLFALQPALEQQPLVKMWPTVIKARDGLELVSYLTLPAAADPDGDGKANTPVPMVLFVHGGPWGRDSWGFNPYHQLLANRGYAVLSVNYRGSTGFGKKFMNAANHQWAKAMHDDLLDAVKWAVDEKIAIKDKVAIMGGSYGGYATLVGLAMTPDVFACGVDIVGPSNLMTLLASIPPYWAPQLAFFKTRVGDPETAEGKAILTAASPLTFAANIKRPLLIGQGANDPRVKQAESEQIVEAMKKHGLPVSYAVFPDEGHGFHRPVNNIAFTAIAEAFLSAHLGGTYLPLGKDELSASTMQIKAGKTGIPGL
jgi:dipeptidyl aminopeptidase/acylaminoacyl peptidase